MIIALDPGTDETGRVIYDGKRIIASDIAPNSVVLNWLCERTIQLADHQLVIEMVASMGMAVGREVFETCVWVGRFQQAWHAPNRVRFVYRQDVKLHLCNSARAKDGNVRQALLDKLGPQGTKNNPGPTFGVSSHAWAALGVAVTAAETRGTKQRRVTKQYRDEKRKAKAKGAKR